MHRAASPDRTAPKALPCECMTPLGGPLLPEVNMMTSGSAAVTVSLMRIDDPAGPFARGGIGEPIGRPNLPQGRKFERRCGLQVVQVAVAAEFLDAHQELD